MTVVTDKSDESGIPVDDDEVAKCIFCNERIVSYPFLYWMSERNVYVCNGCAVGVATGLSADLKQMRAIHELRRCYPGQTLVRKCRGPDWWRQRDTGQR